MNWWAYFTLVFVLVNLLVHIIIITAAIIGGYFDLKAMFAGMMTAEVDQADDGRVIDEDC